MTDDERFLVLKQRLQTNLKTFVSTTGITELNIFSSFLEKLKLKYTSVNDVKCINTVVNSIAKNLTFNNNNVVYFMLDVNVFHFQNENIVRDLLDFVDMGKNREFDEKIERLFVKTAELKTLMINNASNIAEIKNLVSNNAEFKTLVEQIENNNRNEELVKIINTSTDEIKTLTTNNYIELKNLTGTSTDEIKTLVEQIEKQDINDELKKIIQQNTVEIKNAINNLGKITKK